MTDLTIYSKAQVLSDGYRPVLLPYRYTCPRRWGQISLIWLKQIASLEMVSFYPEIDFRKFDIK